MISRLDLVSEILSIFLIFDVFRTPFWGVFWNNYVNKLSMEKDSNKKNPKREHGERGLRQRRGSAEGGEASPRSFAKYLHYYSARPAPSERGAADLQAAASAAELQHSMT